MPPTTSTDTDPICAAVSDGGLPLRPAEILLHLVVTLLAPMFITADGGDIDFARQAALQTVNAYRARNQADLIGIAQIIACGLAAIGSLSLSMADELSLPMTLRLRGNANALIRSAERCRRAISDSDDGPYPPDAWADPGPDLYQDSVIVGMAATEQQVAERHASPRQAAPEPVQSQPGIRQPDIPQPGIPKPVTRNPGTLEHRTAIQTERENKTIWASAMMEVAGEVTGNLRNLPPAERKMASIRAEALRTCANDLIAGVVVPRLQPNALKSLIRPNAP
jgi:hypothetical protein